MREIDVKQITDVVEKLCIEANEHLPEDVKCAIKNCRACEDGEIAKGVLDNIIENFEIADNECVPICQDTGMACVFLEIGQDVHIVGGDLADAINEEFDGAYEYVFDRSQRRAKRESKEMGISAVRGGSIVGEHDVIFAGQDEVITFSHTAYSRAVFGKGAVEAAKYLAGKPAGMYGMSDVING